MTIVQAIHSDAMAALGELILAVESVLESCAWTEPLNGSDPACTVHPDALIAMEDAYDQLIDQLSPEEEDA